VRASFGRFRGCYEQGHQRDPGLEGRVATKFVIARDGSVSMVSVAESSLPDASVAKCVERAFYGLTFPEPEGGIVTVVYPIAFSTSP
jgi:TonB family protein